MCKKILKLNSGEDICIVNSNNGGVYIKNINDRLNIEELKTLDTSNLCINKLSLSELTSFILSILLDNNSLEIKDNKISELITKLLYYQYDMISGDCHNDILDMSFQVITHYGKE